MLLEIGKVALTILIRVCFIMRIFISGGCKNGKSSYAQDIACRLRGNEQTPLYYVATMEPVDHEDDKRILAHIADRDGMGFETLLAARDIANITRLGDLSGSFLLDSLTALLSNEMFYKGELHENIDDKIVKELETVLEKISNIVVVSDFIYADSKEYDPWTEAYRKALARLDCFCAARCDVVIEACYGCFVFHKGKELFIGEKAFKGLHNGIEYVYDSAASSGVGG